jgi:hypothetical protein
LEAYSYSFRRPVIGRWLMPAETRLAASRHSDGTGILGGVGSDVAGERRTFRYSVMSSAE